MMPSVAHCQPKPLPLQQRSGSVLYLQHSFSHAGAVVLALNRWAMPLSPQLQQLQRSLGRDRRAVPLLLQLGQSSGLHPMAAPSLQLLRRRTGLQTMATPLLPQLQSLRQLRQHTGPAAPSC